MERPASWCTEEWTCRCTVCGTVFQKNLPADYELVPFSCGDGKTRFLPVYGPGGYLDLLERLVPGWTRDQAITAKVSGALERELSRRLPYPVELYSRAKLRCPACGGQEFAIEQKQTILNAPIQWLEIPQALPLQP